MAKRKKKPTIDDLLLALKDPKAAGLEKNLPNTKEIWGMIGQKDFAGIAGKAGIEAEEVNDYLAKWMEDNPYKDL